jgi:hypothetical protein
MYRRVVQQSPQLARENRRQLKAILPENVSESWLDAWLAHNQYATVGDACKAMLKESNQQQAATTAADFVNRSRPKTWKD